MRKLYNRNKELETFHAAKVDGNSGETSIPVATTGVNETTLETEGAVNGDFGNIMLSEFKDREKQLEKELKQKDEEIKQLRQEMISQ